MRFDLYLCSQKLSRSRSEAQRLIRAGKASINGVICSQCSRQIGEGDLVSVDRSECRYVSRGGLKLEGALAAFSVDPVGQVCMDIGASTGGFTDCLLQHGAKLVYAVENGHGQLDPTLCSNPRVVSYEGYHAKNLSSADFSETVTLAVMDVSFISQTLLLPAVYRLLPPGGALISLIKPQFEAGKRYIGAGGIVRSDAGRTYARQRVLDCAKTLGFTVSGIAESPILGGDGNIEYLAYFKKGDCSHESPETDLSDAKQAEGS